jgi:hypothetical protein
MSRASSPSIWFSGLAWGLRSGALWDCSAISDWATCWPAKARSSGDYQEFRAWGSILRPEVIPYVRENREEKFTRDTC